MAILLVPIALAVSIASISTRKETTLIFVGDMLFDRYIRTMMERYGDEHIFSCIDEFLQEADLVVGNLEGPITSHQSVSVGSEVGTPDNFTFTHPPQTAELLAAHNIGAVNLGNNHIMNFGQDGLRQTKELLEQARVRYFGDPNAPEEERVLRIEVGGVPLSVVSWSDWTSDKTDHAVAQVRKEVEAGRVAVVYAHWGEEYIGVLPRVRQLGRSFIDAGAALVVGSHPHVVQEHELYNGKHIYYSLGNFIFDQYWNTEVSRGLALSATITQDGIEVAEHPVELLRDGRTCLSN